SSGCSTRACASRDRVVAAEGRPRNKQTRHPSRRAREFLARAPQDDARVKKKGRPPGGRPSMPVREEGRGRGSVAVGVDGVVAIREIILRGLPAAARRRGRNVADEAEGNAGEDEREDKGLGEHGRLRGVRAAGAFQPSRAPWRIPASPTVNRFTVDQFRSTKLSEQVLPATTYLFPRYCWLSPLERSR